MDSKKTVGLFSNSSYISAISSRRSHASRFSQFPNRLSGLLPGGRMSSTIVQRSTSTFSSQAGKSAMSTRPMGDSARLEEKRELSILNDKFASYVERVRFLEAQNRKLMMDMGILRDLGKSGDTVTQMFTVEMQAINSAIEQGRKEHEQIEQKCREEQELYDEAKMRQETAVSERELNQEKVTHLNEELSKNEAELAILKRRVDDMEYERRIHQQEVNRIIQQMDDIQNDIQSEVFLRSNLEAEKLAVDQEIDVLKMERERRLEDVNFELQSRSGASSVFRGELAKSIRTIRTEYEESVEQHRTSLHNKYVKHCNELIMNNNKGPVAISRISERSVTNERIRQTLESTRAEEANLRSRNHELSFKVAELRAMIEKEHEENELTCDEYTSKMKKMQESVDRLKAQLESANSDHISMKTEIDKYRELLEGEDGLAFHIEQMGRVTGSRAMPEALIESDTTANGISRSVSMSSSSVKYNVRY